MIAGDHRAIAAARHDELIGGEDQRPTELTADAHVPHQLLASLPLRIEELHSVASSRSLGRCDDRHAPGAPDPPAENARRKEIFVRYETALPLRRILEVAPPVRLRFEREARHRQKERGHAVVHRVRVHLALERALAPRELIRLGQRVVVARGQKRPQLEGHLPRQEFVQDDRRVLALNCGNRLAQQCASGFVLERREKIAPEGEEMLEA